MFFLEPEPLSGPRRCRFLQDRSALGPPCISMPRAQRGQSSLPVPDGTPDPTNLRAWIDSGSTRGFYGAVLDWRRLQCFQSLWDHDVKWELFTDDTKTVLKGLLTPASIRVAVLVDSSVVKSK